MEVKKTQLPIWWEEIEKNPLNHALWGTTYQPLTWVKMAYIEKDAVYLNMFVEETNPKASYHHDQDPVYKDSCLECFLNFNPTEEEQYLNFEMNANGAMLVGLGCGRADREALTFDFHPYVFKNENGWGITLIIPEAFILKYFKKIAGEWLGNFYKCGDECASVHFLSWAEVKEDKPNFHAPQWFGKIHVGS